MTLWTCVGNLTGGEHPSAAASRRASWCCWSAASCAVSCASSWSIARRTPSVSSLPPLSQLSEELRILELEAQDLVPKAARVAAAREQTALKGFLLAGHENWPPCTCVSRSLVPPLAPGPSLAPTLERRPRGSGGLPTLPAELPSGVSTCPGSGRGRAQRGAAAPAELPPRPAASCRLTVLLETVTVCLPAPPRGRRRLARYLTLTLVDDLCAVYHDNAAIINIIKYNTAP